MPFRMRLLATVLTLMAGTAGAHADESVLVTLDQAKVIRIAAPASTIIIGNPAIADATLQDAQTLVITGRAYGTTNMIILDSEGEPIADNQISVQAPVERQVTLHKGVERYSLSCAPVCQPATVPGDSTTFFDGITAQTNARSGTATGQAAPMAGTIPN